MPLCQCIYVLFKYLVFAARINEEWTQTKADQNLDTHQHGRLLDKSSNEQLIPL